MSRIEVRGLGKRFGAGSEAVDALASVDLTVRSAEIVAIVGPSGCGKSTLLRAIGGLTAPTAGTVTIGGHDVWSADRAQRPALRGVSVVFQEANLLPWMSVANNIALPLLVEGHSREARRSKALELCAMTGIAGFEDRRPDELSIGMRQRAALARALAAEPEVLLLDEPFAALDALTRDAMNLELQRLWERRPVTVLLVTHSIAEAVFLADRVVTLTPRPGTVSSSVDVALPRPRTDETQEGTDFQEIVSKLRRTLLAAR